MTARKDCRHYSTRTVPAGPAGDDIIQRCRVDAAATTPFACPEDCLFFEPRSLGTGWQIG